MRSKKGVIEVQFNWVFIIVVGTIILMLFFGLVNTQREISERKIANKIMMHLQSIITGAGESSNTIHYIDIPKTDISFGCDPTTCSDFGCSSSYSIENSQTNPIPIETIFAPELIRGKILITWSKPWVFPFEVSSFLYLTTPEVRYVFVTDGSDLANRVYNDLPEKVSKEMVDSAGVKDIEDEDNYKIKFIYFNQDPGTLPSFAGSMHPLDVVAVKIIPDPINPDIDGVGWLNFYHRDKSNNQMILEGDSNYLGEASLFGAIFSENLDHYECTMKKALLRLRKITDVYILRANDLKLNYQAQGKTSCENSMGYGSTYLQDIKNNAGDISLTLYASVKQLQDENSQMRNYFSCEGLY